ncbi:hypothetical protein Pmar_PMAR023974 [Perkinsus marinus ATCC 50983]|uniref:Uncharacterized protein n=1 Tax=Perkinsus marinus (strain ATCC 50983 / TXsc) TaxID=423536 RepID=C5L340_PERM5|nr:hypothetical protein Pmar_PMAR023974 [Perkinsus marinus ATCC 50983]EER08835.1 hypothetical protein Pmar_PMAR023974 [Perkinsus marinus ATCC 50983]|eukprot:XP_002777019.1 hypothetical protein Pmar_PMAR023974 [Perkinsus marinus ATCC 50983]
MAQQHVLKENTPFTMTVPWILHKAESPKDVRKQRVGIPKEVRSARRREIMTDFASYVKLLREKSRKYRIEKKMKNAEELYEERMFHSEELRNLHCAEDSHRERIRWRLNDVDWLLVWLEVLMVCIEEFVRVMVTTIEEPYPNRLALNGIVKGQTTFDLRNGDRAVADLPYCCFCWEQFSDLVEAEKHCDTSETHKRTKDDYYKNNNKKESKHE